MPFRTRIIEWQRETDIAYWNAQATFISSIHMKIVSSDIKTSGLFYEIDTWYNCITLKFQLVLFSVFFNMLLRDQWEFSENIN